MADVTPDRAPARSRNQSTLSGERNPESTHVTDSGSDCYTLGSDDRAVSPVFGYVLTLSIATLLVGGLLISAGGFIDEQRRNTAESELRVVGQQVSADIAAADRLARTDGAENLSVERTIPQDVVGSTYSIKVVDGGGPTSPYLELSASNPDVTVVVGIASKTQVSSGSSADGGRIVVEYDGSVNEVVLRNG